MLIFHGKNIERSEVSRKKKMEGKTKGILKKINLLKRMGLLETEIADVFCFVDFLNIVLFVFYLIALLGQFLAFKVA